MPGRLTPDQIVDEALARNARILADRYDISIAEARILQSRMRPNPSFYGSGQYLDVFGAGFSLANPGGPPELDLGANFVIEQRGKRAARIALAEANRNATQADVLDRTRRFIVQVEYAIVEAQLASENLALINDRLRSLETIVKLNQTRVRAGDLAEVELTRSEVAALQFQNLARQAEARLKVARNSLQTIMGRLVYDTTFEVAGDLRRDPLPGTLSEWQAAALKQRPDLTFARRDLERTRADLRLQQKTTIGDTLIQPLFTRQSNIGIIAGRAFTFSVTQPLPLFNRNRGEIERARQEGSQAGLRIRALETEIAGEVQNAWVQLNASAELLTSIETTMLDRARRVREIMEYSYRRGEAGFIEFLDAQRVFSETMQTFNEARADYARSLYLIEAAAGGPRRP
ncbi:MAG: TolC family protein [Bryobacterales bacterium]|nr:TolC family protein [Bryobacterales bacterium]